MFKTITKSVGVFKALYRSDEICMNISSHKYNSILQEMNKRWARPSSYHNISVYNYYSYAEKMVIHIENEEIASKLYLALGQDIAIPNDFFNLRFINIRKQKKTVFAIFDKSVFNNPGEKMLSKLLVEYADKFCEFFSTEDSKFYVDYAKLFSISSIEYWNISLFESLRFEPFENSYNQLAEIVDAILSSDRYAYSWSTLSHNNPKYSNDSFTFWLRKGIFCANERPRSKINFDLEINILRFALDPNYIKDIHELWTKDIIFPSSYDDLMYVIDEKIFSKYIEYKEENDDFILYSDRDDSYVFAKFKDHTIYPKYKEVVNEAIKRSYIINTHFLESTNMGNYILLKKQYINTLHNCIYSNAHTDERFLTLIESIEYCGKQNKYLKDLYFRKETDFLNIMSMKDINSTPVIINPLDIVFREDVPRIPFDYKQLIMLAIKEYMKWRSISVKDIYSFKIINTLTPDFTMALIRFIETGVYDAQNIFAVFNSCNMSQIEFIENLDYNDKKLMARVTIQSDKHLNRHENLKKALEKAEKEQKNNNYVSMKSLKSSINILDKTTAFNLFSKANAQDDFFMVPEKVIVSSDDTWNNCYLIIGIVWNHSNLRNALSVISAGDIDCRDLYFVIHALLKKGLSLQLHITDNANTDKDWYIDMLSKKPVLYDKKLDYSNYYYRSMVMNPLEYYRSINMYLCMHCNYQAKYDAYSFSDLTANASRMGPTAQLDAMYRTILNMEQCKYHNHWHLKDKLCPICEKIFESIELSDDSKEECYTNVLGQIYCDAEDNVIYNFTGGISSIDSLRIAFENDFFKDFVGLVPYKLIVDGDKISTNSVLYDTEDEDFDLEQSIISLESLKNVQRLKAILVMYKKILPLINDDRFITTNPDIFNTLIMHKDFKGEIIIPGLPLLEFDTIFSTDEFKKLERRHDTKQVFADFLVRYIKSDAFLKKMLKNRKKPFVNIINDIKALSFSSDVITLCVDMYKNFCTTHQNSYPTDHLLCPECMKLYPNMDNLILYDKSHFDGLRKQNSEYDGGEADIYPANDTHVQKIFKSHVDFAFKAKIISKAFEKAFLIEEFNKSNKDIKIISIDKVIYMKSGNTTALKGFTQEFVKDAHNISCLKDKNFVNEHEYTRRDIVKILIKVCKGIEFIHSIGGFIGDLNGGNILIRGTDVYFIDIDGMSFDEVKNSVYTNMYIYPPSAESHNISAEDDWYSLAVQAFYYLTHSHPFRGISKDKAIPANETERMKLGISLLGNHGLVPPSICLGWDFMSSELVQYFLDTFEGKRRESMLNLLEKYHLQLVKQDLFFVDATKQQVLQNLNEHTYINIHKDIIYKEKTLFNVSGYSLINTSKNGIVVSFNDHTYFYDTIREKQYTLHKVYSSSVPMSICDGNIYYTSNDGCNFLVDIPDPETGNTKTHTINKPSNYPIIRLRVDEPNRFVFVERNSNINTFDIYCNSHKLLSVSSKSFTPNVQVQILYDALSFKWLVVFKDSTTATLVVIDKDSGSTNTITLEKALSRSLCFYGNTLYYVGDNNIYFYNINNRKHQSIECRFADKDSSIFRYDNKFVVMSATQTYVYQKS